jgi:hypothetical protein
MSPKAGFVLINEIVPRLRVAIPNSVCCVGSEDAEELVQDAVATAAKMLHSVEARGKSVTPGNICYYAVKLTRQGRRSTGQRKSDPLDPMAQLNGSCSLVSLNAPLTSETDGEEGMCLHDALASRSADPSQEAAKRLDWAPLINSLDGPVREVLRCLVEGGELTSLVPKLQRSRSSLQTDKMRLAELVREHLGEDVLRQAQEQPRWRDSVQASRERSACRCERLSA